LIKKETTGGHVRGRRDVKEKEDQRSLEISETEVGKSQGACLERRPCINLDHQKEKEKKKGVEKRSLNPSPEILGSSEREKR